MTARKARSKRNDFLTQPSEDIDSLLVELNARADKADYVVALTASEMMTTVRGTSGGKPHYRQENILGGQEFIFQEVRQGGSDLIFTFKPMDMQPYTHIELPAAKIFEVFPTTVDLFDGITGFNGFSDDLAPSASFTRYVSQFIQAREDERKEKERVRLEAEEEAKRKEADFYADNELYGAF